MGLISIFKPLSANQCRWLTSETSIIFPLKIFCDCWESNPGLLGEKHCCPLLITNFCDMTSTYLATTSASISCLFLVSRMTRLGTIDSLAWLLLPAVLDSRRAFQADSAPSVLKRKQFTDEILLIITRWFRSNSLLSYLGTCRQSFMLGVTVLKSCYE